KVNVFDDSLRKVKIGELNDKLDSQKTKLNILQQELDQTSKKYGEGSTQAQKKALAVDDLTKAIGRTEDKIQSEQTALEKEKTAFDASAHAAAAAAPAVETLGKATKDSGDDAKAAAPKFDAFRE